MKFLRDFFLDRLSKLFSCMGARFGGVAIGHLAVGLSIALGLFAGPSALAAITFTVTTLADTTGSCTDNSCTTLRAAIAAANSSPGNTINFTGLSGTITLTSALPNITESMTIAGPGATGLTISGNGAYQILHVSTGTVVISGMTFANGSTGAGGAIYNAGTLTVSGGTLSGNQAPGNASVGGAIENVSTLTVINSTFSDSFAATDGGAIDNTGTLTVTNSTFSGNQASNGGAISNSGTMIANNNIVAGNSAASGAGVFNRSGTTSASHNLFYQNLDAGTTEDDCSGCTGNTNAISANPNLLPLGSYGGPTQTLLPQPGSPAICAGSYADVPSGITTDQRGFPLTNSTCSNGGVDVGAVQTGYMQVTTTADSDDGSCTASLCSLRDAITAANATNYGSDIAFASGVTGTITLTSALPAISQSMVILGPGAGTLAISGNHAYQIFNFNDSSATVAISGLAFANGNSAIILGGAICSIGRLTVIDSTFSGNSQPVSGGAIYSTSQLFVIDSAFSGNSAQDGGAISFEGALLAVINSSFSGNSTPYTEGAIQISGSSSIATVTNSSFSGNIGGAILAGSGTLTANNNIFTGNSALVGAGILADTGTVNANYNLYYQNLDTGGFEDDCLACTTNANAITGINPLLSALDSYGGPQQTMLPQPGSPAICAGSTTLIPSGIITDQRGFSRTTTYSGTACVDLGPVQTDYTAVAFGASSYSGIANQPINPAPVVTVTENGQNIGGVLVALGFSGTGSPTGLGPVQTVGGTGATFSNLEAAAAGARGTLSVTLPITASGNAVQPAALTASATLNIPSTTQTITFSAPSPLTYGAAPVTLTAIGGASGNPVVLTLDASSTPGAATLSGSTLTIHGVGTVVIDANQAAGSGYSAAPQVQQSIVVSRASLTITASSPTVTYGSAVPTITPTFGTFFNGDTSAVLTKQPTCVTAYTTTSAAGSSPSTSCSGAAAANYTFTYINGSVNINPATQNITFSARSPLTYGTGPVTLTATGGGSGNPVTFTLAPSSTPGAATLSGSTLTIHRVGTVVIDANQAAGSGYTAAPQVQQSIVVSRASLTITASSPTVTYGSAVPTITPTFGTFFNGDTTAVLTTQPTCVTVYATTSAVGSSPSTSCSGAAAANYTFTYINGLVTINAAAQVIALAVPSSLTYGTGSIALAATGGASGNPVTFTLAPTSTLGAATLSGSTLTIHGVGTVVIDANQAAGADYSAAPQAQQSIVVSPASLTITASSPTATYGSAVPTITPIFGTFVNGDTSAVLTTQPTCVTAYTTTSAVGSSPSTSCSGAAAANYTFTYISGSATIKPASLTITASSPTVTYGSAVPTITPMFGTFVNGDTSAVLTTQPTCVTAYTTTSAIGSSPSTSCSGAAAANYTFTYINGSVTVNAVPTFTIGGGGGSTSISIEPGATTGNTVSIPVTPSNGFTGTVNLTCSISPVAASDPPTCSLSPASVTITGTAAQTATLTISTTASTVGENRLQRLLWPSTGTTLALVLIVGVPRRRRNWLAMMGVLALSIAIGATGCGGGATSSGGGGSSTGGNSGTTPGTYTVTVTGTTGSVTGTAATVTLTVQ